MILVFLWSYLILLKRANKAILGVRSSMIKERSKSFWKGRLKKKKNHPAISPEYRDVQWPPAPWPGEREGWRDNQLYCLPAGGESHLKLKHGPFFKFDHDSTSTMYHTKPWFEEWMITCSGNWVEGGDNQAGLWGPEKGDHMLATEMGLSSTVCNENGPTHLFGRTIATTCPGWAPSLANPPATCLPTKSKASRFWENHNSSSTSPTMTILGVQR